MDFLKNNARFSFKLDGTDAFSLQYTKTVSVNKNEVITEYLFPGGLKITNKATYYEKFGAYEWVNYLENTSDVPTGIISDLCDCDCELPMPHEDDFKCTTYMDRPKTLVYHPNGSQCTWREFYCNDAENINDRRINHMSAGESREYTSGTGRSADTDAPWFDVRKDDTGYIFAVGWSGKWRTMLDRNPDSIRIRTKIDDTHFRMHAGESFRTSSVVILPFKADYNTSHNTWRRFVKEELSLIAAPGRDKFAPLAVMLWGGMKTDEAIRRINVVKDNNIPFEYVWVDAGWYGADTEPSHDEFEGDWGAHTGDWRISKKIHPKGMVDLAEAAHNAGMKFLLWLEPERVVRHTPIVSEHPEYFLCNDDENTWNMLLDLGNPDAWNYCFQTISDLIDKLGIDCYRQDFNFDPLLYWRKYDWGDRRGITEIKYINGLYKLWDSLLAKYPHLIIDNCSSGGRRIDIEMARRSIPLWRSDLYCNLDFDDFGAQFHNLTFSSWMPYSGTGLGLLSDMYRARSAYAPAICFNHAHSAKEPFGDTPESIELMKKIANEFLKVRPYLSEDFYPLTVPSDTTDTWCASQFDRPSEGDGILQIFRRENSPYPKAAFTLYNIDENAVYSFTDSDDNRSFELSGKQLSESGFEVELEKRGSKIYFYSQK